MPRITKDGVRSHSGHERNRLFVNRGGTFVDHSTASGVDSPADGRAFGILDYDDDGRLDIALVNANAPLLQLFHNEVRGGGRTLRLRLQGRASNRDGCGARLTVYASGRRLTREHRCGEGFAAQHSSTVRIGVGNVERLERIDVRWPSGQQQKLVDVSVGETVIIREPHWRTSP